MTLFRTAICSKISGAVSTNGHYKAFLVCLLVISCSLRWIAVQTCHLKSYGSSRFWRTNNTIASYRRFFRNHLHTKTAFPLLKICSKPGKSWAGDIHRACRYVRPRGTSNTIQNKPNVAPPPPPPCRILNKDP
jgi:hypothetical protein